MTQKPQFLQMELQTVPFFQINSIFRKSLIVPKKNFQNKNYFPQAENR